MYVKGGVIKFGTLPKGSWFADWNIIHKLRSIVTYVSAPGEGQNAILLLCVSREKFHQLLDAYPSEKRYFERFSLQRRFHIHRAMEEEHK